MKTILKRVIWVASVVALLQGCVTQFSIGSGAEEAEPQLRFQSNSIAPTAIVEPEFLEPGDILLTSEPTVISASIRVMTLAPVSHAAVYVGDGHIVDAMAPGVRIRDLDTLLDEAAAVLVLRYPELTAEQAAGIAQYSVNQAGTGFNFLGISLHVPFSIVRRLCELPLVTASIRDACLRSMGVMHRLAASESRVFCSQLVLQAYRHAGVRVTNADPRLVSPADILHMREGDVPSLNIAKRLRYIGHLKSTRPVTPLASLQ
jgi:Permuted papain-like amidase enzyme, YaeF/YiiX, C92 family